MLLAFFSDRSTCGILVPQPGIEPTHPHVGSMASSPLNHQGNPLALTFKMYLEFIFSLPPTRLPRLSCHLAPHLPPGPPRFPTPTVPTPSSIPYIHSCGHWSWGARALPIAHPKQLTAFTSLCSSPTTCPLPLCSSPVRVCMLSPFSCV